MIISPGNFDFKKPIIPKGVKDALIFAGKDKGLSSKFGGGLGQVLGELVDVIGEPFAQIGTGIGKGFKGAVDVTAQAKKDPFNPYSGKLDDYEDSTMMQGTVVNPELNKLIKDLNKKTGRATLESDDVASTGKIKGATESQLTIDDDETFGLGETKTDAKTDTGTGTGTGTGGLTPEEQLMKSGMDSYIAALGEDVEIGSIEDYKKEFEKATGIDASGKVDKSMALTALGLALMQNKAGKGFNVGNILSEVGKAGEKALPALEKAKAEARAGQLAAGKYALGQRQKDIGVNQAKSQDIANKIFELNKMSVGQSYDMQKMNQKFIYDLRLQQQQLQDEIAIAQMTPKEYGDKYMKSASTEKLFDDFDIKVQLADGNYKGPDKGKNLLLTDINVIAEEMKRREQGFNDVEQQFNKLSGLIDQGVTVKDQLGSMVIGYKKAFGYGKGLEDPVAEAKYILETIQAQEAPLILGEAGKTISDADRERVKRIVGAIDLSKDGANADLLFKKLDEVYRLVVDRGRKNLDSAYGKLNQYGYKLGPYAQKEMDRQEADNIAG